MGLPFTLWVVLFVVRTRLIALGHRRLHQALGIAGVALAAIAIATTYAAGIEAVRLGVERGGFGIERLYSNVLVLTLFALFLGLGTAFRKRPELHKAFMLLAMIAAIGPAVTRAVVVLGLTFATLTYLWNLRWCCQQCSTTGRRDAGRIGCCCAVACC